MRKREVGDGGESPMLKMMKDDDDDADDDDDHDDGDDDRRSFDARFSKISDVEEYRRALALLMTAGNVSSWERRVDTHCHGTAHSLQCTVQHLTVRVNL